jgi:hypothetical protein
MIYDYSGEFLERRSIWYRIDQRALLADLNLAVVIPKWDFRG